jgi:hypothetical protein
VPSEETPRCVVQERIVVTTWGVFYEKAQIVKAALAADLLVFTGGPSPSLLSAL